MDNQNNPTPTPEPVVNPPMPTTTTTPSYQPITPQAATTPQPIPPKPTEPTLSSPFAATGSSLPVQPSQKKGSLLWLWITLGVVTLLAIIAGIVLFMSKQAADTAAHEYTSATTAYVKKVYDSVDKSSSIAEAKEDLEEASSAKPVLKTAFLSDLSGDYSKAKTLGKTTEDKVREFSLGIAELASIDAYITDSKSKYADITSAVRAAYSATSRTSAVAGLEDALKLIEDVESTTKDTAFPSTLADTKKDLLEAYEAEIDSWKKMIAAAKNGDSTAYEAAYEKFHAAGDQEAEAFIAVYDYFYDISSKQDELLEKFDSFRKTL
ncbi:MAG: hypothetical protein WBP12_05525 [Candidatus Saccharimonas sp.]